MASIFRLILAIIALSFTQSSLADALDDKVRSFLNEHEDSWRDYNIPARDGQVLFDLIVEEGFKQALEIGTSTGHSTIWIAWALSKTGGKLTTIEIDEERHLKAKENLAAVGLSDYVEFILGDAHQLVPQQEGPFGFIFSDADKDWYIQYFKDVYPKMTDNACLAAHNVRKSSWRGWVKEYVRYIEGIEDMATKYYDNGAGMSLTCKK